ncbi:cdkn1a interacting zinc finger protein 1a [Aulostomus maculatus]
MFNPHIHQQQQQQQQQQFHQHLRQLQQLFQQQPPPPPPPQPPPGHHVTHHHHQTPRAIPVPPQTAPPPRMVNLCQATQTTIISPNPMLQGALLMQQMQGNMRGFGMVGQQFRQFFTAANRSSLLGPVPMGMAIKSPIMGFPAARPFHPHARYYNNTSTASTSASTITTDAAARQPDRKRDSEQMAVGGGDDQPATSSTSEANDKTETDVIPGVMDGTQQSSEEQLEEPSVKRQRTEGSEEPKEQNVAKRVTVVDTDGDVLSSECNSNTDNSQPEDCVTLEEVVGAYAVEVLEDSNTAEVHGCSSVPSPAVRLREDSQQVQSSLEEIPQDKDAPLPSPDNQEVEEDVAEGTNKFYCYLCSITCHSQKNFRSHMNSISHQQRMMEIQHMSNACLVTLLPRVQESLQGANKDGEKKADSQRWCTTCHTHFAGSIKDHRHTEEHKLASRTAFSSCTVCKKRFRTSQNFVEHLQSQEHRQQVEKLQENEGSEALSKLTAMDTHGFSLEEEEEDEEGSEVEEEEVRQQNEGEQESSEKQDGWTPHREVTLKDMASDEQYDPDIVYGSSFFVPVAGFICRICNKFYHFESSTLHAHCKSLKHFENLKRHKALLSQKVESSPVEDSLRPVTETTTDCLEESSLSSGTLLGTNQTSMQPVITLDRLRAQAENQQQEEGAEPAPTSLDFTSSDTSTSTHLELSHHSQEEEEEEPASQASVDPEIPAQLLDGGSDPTAAAEDANEEEEKEAAALPSKKNGTEKAKRRRSGRATSRR